MQTFYHDIPCDRVFSQNIQNLSGIFAIFDTSFSLLLGNWRINRRLSVNIRVSLERSKARIVDDRLRDLRPQRSRLGLGFDKGPEAF